jgi:predicted transcriptional regulator
MPEDELELANQRLTTDIVSAYVKRNQIAAEQLTSLISSVHRALAQLGETTQAVAAERTPAVSIRRSVQRDIVVCLDCGWQGQILKRHLMTAHGLSVEDYRKRWNLRHDHAVIAPAYSERRSGLAKELRLGRRGTPASTASELPG